MPVFQYGCQSEVFPSRTCLASLASVSTPTAALRDAVAFSDFGTQGFLQRIQPSLVVPPLLEARPEDRLPHLLGTGRADAALGLVVVDAGLLEGKSAELKDPAYLAFEVVDDLLVLNAEDETRQHPVPVVHELDVLAVVVADLR